MRNRLARARTGVDDRSIASAIRQSALVGYPRGDPKQMSEQRFVLLSRVLERLPMLVRNHHQMRRSLGINIASHHAPVVPDDHVGRTHAIQYPPKHPISSSHPFVY